MDLSITAVPTWVSVSFALSFFISVPVLIAHAFSQAFLKNGDSPFGKKIRNRILTFFIILFIIVCGISLTGFFKINVLPPRIFVFVSIPLFIFYLAVVQKMSWFKSAFAAIKMESLVAIHLFRFVGVFFLINYSYDALPEEFALIGGIGDIISAFMALFYITIVWKKSFARTYLWIFNIVGLLDILSVVTTAILVTNESIKTGDAGLLEFATFPFILIPAFAPGTIIFIHILIFKKLINRSEA